MNYHYLLYHRNTNLLLENPQSCETAKIDSIQKQVPFGFQRMFA